MAGNTHPAERARFTAEALEALSPGERKECLALWQEGAALLSRVQTLK
jgi:hypothetical protein